MQNSMRLTALSIVAATAMTPVAGWAQELPGTFSGNIALANDYVFRGYSQTLEDSTVQGGLDWDSGAGFYLGTWASNVKFGDPDDNIELDVYAGYRGALENGLSYDFALIGYLYPESNDALNYDYLEVKGQLGYDFEVFNVAGAVYYSPEFFGGIGDAWYFWSKLGVPLAEGLSVDATLGYQDLQPAGASYADWSFGLTYAFDWFATDLRYYDTDVAGSTLADSRFVVKFSRAF